MLKQRKLQKLRKKLLKEAKSKMCEGRLSEGKGINAELGFTLRATAYCPKAQDFSCEQYNHLSTVCNSPDYESCLESKFRGEVNNGKK